MSQAAARIFIRCRCFFNMGGNILLLKSVREKWPGLDTFQIKVIACLCMTIDHIGAYMSNDFIMKYDGLLRIIGRIAAPLFLFILVQSIRYTRDRLNLLKRLYLAGALVGLSDTAFNLLLGERAGIHFFGNIIFTYFYVAFYAILIEKVILAIKGKKVYECLKLVALGTISLLTCVVYRIIDWIVPNGIPIQQRLLFQGVRDSLLPAVDHLEYGIGFVILGVILYFAKKKTWQCLVYFMFCIICICGNAVAIINPDIYDIYASSSFAWLYFDGLQHYMILALPVMMMYNQRKGRDVKAFFYWYYPVHRFFIIIVSAIIA